MADGVGGRNGMEAVEHGSSMWRGLPRKVLIWFLAADAALVLLYAVNVLAGTMKNRALFDLFDLNMEANLPSWYSSMQLLLVAVVLLSLASPLFRDHPGVARLRRLWVVLGMGFVYLSADEGGAIHERLSQLMAASGGRSSSSPLTALLHAAGINRAPRGAGLWILLYVAIGIVVVALLVPMIGPALRTFRGPTLLFVAGFAVMLAGGVVVEGIGDILHFVRSAHLLEVGIEEMLEMGGVTVMLYSGVRVLSRAAESLANRPSVGSGEPPAEALESA
jgi:hypothetical protein